MKPWETEPGVWKEFTKHFYHGCLITEKGMQEFHAEKYHGYYKIFKAGYEKGFEAADNGDSDAYYELMKGREL